MKDEKKLPAQISRRKFIGSAAAAATFSLIPLNYQFGSDFRSIMAPRPNSRFGGVQVGAITYSWRDMPGSAEEVLQYCLTGGISSIELMSNVVEQFAGCPQAPVRPASMSDTEKAAYGKAVKEIGVAQRKWRLTAPMKKFEEFRKMYNSAGVNIHIAKFSPAGWSDEEIDYSFKAAKVLGASGVCNEIGDEPAKRLGKFAEKHNMFAIMHQHLQPAEPGWTFDKFLAYSPKVMLNFDAGHYFGSTGLHPNGIIERLHDRIVSVHLKDKTGPKSNPANTNMPWGKGETPIADILLLLKKKKWPINVDIELEYKVPEGSTSVEEVKKCVEFCKNILT